MFPIAAIDQNLSKKESVMNNATEHTLSKVPELTLIFWIIKIAATTLGETGGDAVSMSMNLGYLVASAIFAAIFFIAVVAQIKAKKFHPFVYWTTIIATTTVGTTLADFADRSLGIGYTGGATLLFALLMASLAIWYKTLGSVSVDTVSSPKEEMFYWITIMFSQTLGTALGDWTADDDRGGLALGYGHSALIFGGALIVIAALWWRTRLSRTALFWAAFAGPPFLTYDPEPVDRHHAEINLLGQQMRTSAGRGGSLSGEVTLGCAA